MKYILSIVLLCLNYTLIAQNWKAISYPNKDAEQEAAKQKLVHADIAQTFTLNLDEFIASSHTATREGRLKVSLPFPDGTIMDFILEKYDMMEPNLAKKYRFINTMKGVSIDDASIKARIDYSPYGFHGVITTADAKYYIDPLYEDDVTHYVSYDLASINIDSDIPTCGVNEKLRDVQTHHSRYDGGDNIPLTTYRIAISCTGEFGRRHGTTEQVMSYIVASVNKINEIFENELSIRLLIVDRNDELLYFDSETDPYTDTSNGAAMLQINTAVINSIIDASAYDVGHVYNTGCNVGGIASISSMCSSIKGNGVTCLASNSLAYYVGVTAHEIGHQMSAQHTFNSCRGNNESVGSGYEPGSGTTIMSYSGLCDDQNVVSGSGDNYYHTASLIQIYNHLRGSYPECGEEMDIGNYEPTVQASELFTRDLAIPTKTPFVLEGSGADKNESDVLTYTWEQMNLGPASPLGSPISTAPRFRSIPPSTNSYRLLPRVGNIMSGTGSRAEVLPDLDMELIFHLTVRDNHEPAGTSAFERVIFECATPSEDEGEFAITSFNGGGTYAPGQKATFTWNVSNTTGDKINTKYMDLYYTTSNNSIDFNNMRLLAERIPNTGAFDIYLPTNITNNGRFILRAHDNIYFTVNQYPIRIADPEIASIAVDASPFVQQVCTPQDVEIAISTSGYQDIEGQIDFKVVSELPEGIEVSFIPNNVLIGEDAIMDVNLENYEGSEWIEIEFESSVAEIDTFTRSVWLNIMNNDHSAIAPAQPLRDQVAVPYNTDFSWSPSPNAATYDFQLATSPRFGEDDIVFEAIGLRDTTFESPDLLGANTIYYWRVKGNNECRVSEYEEIYAFSTEVVDCKRYTPTEDELPKYISQTGKPTVTAEIEIEEGGNVSELNIPLVQIAHARNKDLKVSLIAPDGKKAVLFDRICLQRNVKCGFNDDSNTNVTCPLNNGKQYRPKESLSIFNGTSKEGIWSLEVQDTKAGDGGQIDNFQLDLCGSVDFNSPYMTINERLELPPNDIQAIKGNQLRAEDDDNPDNEIIYTLTSIPSLGYLELDGQLLNIGDEVSQQQINDHRFIYHAPEDEGETSFSFTLKDNIGGFVGITNYAIDIDANYPSAIINNLSDDINIYPNPTSEKIYIETTDVEVLEVQLYNINGQLQQTNQLALSQMSTIDISDLTPGNYLLKITTKEGVAVKIVSIIR